MNRGWLYRAGVPTAVLGAGDKAVVHEPSDYVMLDDVIAFAKTRALVVLRRCRARQALIGAPDG
jgi:hypothetical protein